MKLNTTNGPNGINWDNAVFGYVFTAGAITLTSNFTCVNFTFTGAPNAVNGSTLLVSGNLTINAIMSGTTDIILNGTGTGGLNFWKPSGSDDNFGNYFLFLSDNGNAGIGNNNPQATLDVTGTIKSSSLAGTGTNMIIADASGLLSTQAIPAAQTLSINQNQLTISGGNTVILPDNDNQTLSVSLNTLSISGGNSVTLPSGADNLGNHSATQDIKLNGHRITNSSSSSLGFTIQNNFGDGRFDNNLFVNGDLSVNQNTQMNGTLTVNGLCYNSTGTWIISDTRYKKNIEELESPLKKVLKIRGVRYEYNIEGFPKLNFKEGKTIGFIAQELKEVFPEAVMLKEDGYYAVNYDEIVPVLVEAIKEQ